MAMKTKPTPGPIATTSWKRRVWICVFLLVVAYLLAIIYIYHGPAKISPSQLSPYATNGAKP